jgi:hypothetical protein
MHRVVLKKSVGATPLNSCGFALYSIEYCERFVRSIKEEALSRMIFIGEGRYATPFITIWHIITVNAIIRDWRIS